MIRYEANPPKILPDVNLDNATLEFVNKIKTISTNCDALHLTENVLGFHRMSPIEIGKIIKNNIPNLPITTSLRVRDKTEDQIELFVENCIDAGFSSILVIMGDPSQDGRPDSGEIPSKVVKRLSSQGIDSKIDLYLSIPNEPNFAKLEKKIDANPKGFITQVIQSTKQVQNIHDNLSSFNIIPILLFPSKKNIKSAKFLDIDFTIYENHFEEFVSNIHKITGDVLITSPNDFNGLESFLHNRNFTLN